MSTNKEILSLYAKKIAFNNKNLIDDICTNSSHKYIIMQSINAIAESHPEWFPSLMAISQYYKEQWVLKQNIQINNFDDIFSREVIINGKFKFDLSERVTTIISDFIDAESKKLEHFSCEKEFMAFKAAHILDHKDVSKYIIVKYYGNALKAFCSANNEEIKKCFEDYKAVIKLLDEDQKSAFHDTVKLIKTLRNVYKKNKVLTLVNEENLFKLIDSCLLTIKKYPADGETMYNILRYYIYGGYSDYKIGAFCCKSETFVRNKKKLAVDIMSLMLWGYSSKKMFVDF